MFIPMTRVHVPRPLQQIVRLSGAGILSFDEITMPLQERVTVIVGPNGAGKSNLTRLLMICQRAV